MCFMARRTHEASATFRHASARVGTRRHAEMAGVNKVEKTVMRA
jgi:hypothetical protein